MRRSSPSLSNHGARHKPPTTLSLDLCVPSQRGNGGTVPCVGGADQERRSAVEGRRWGPPEDDIRGTYGDLREGPRLSFFFLFL